MIRPKYILALLCALLVVLFLAACTNGDDDPTPEVVYYTVSFDSQMGTEIADMKVAAGKHIKEPVEPVRDGYVFDGWRLGGKEWLFETATVQSDITLTAKWIDAAQVFNYVPVEGGACITEAKREMNSIVIPSVINGLDVLAIAPHAFENPQNVDLLKIVIPESVVEIGDYAFAECENIVIEIRGSLTKLGEFAFYKCNLLKKVPFGEGIEQIPYGAFSGCASLKEVRLPQSLKVIGENAFEECSSLTSVMMHSTTASIEDAAFRFCNKLAAIYYYGTQEQFSQTVIANNGNDKFISANLCLYSATKPQNVSSGTWWYMDSNEKVKIWN